jgi:hypothetical protein
MKKNILTITVLATIVIGAILVIYFMTRTNKIDDANSLTVQRAIGIYELARQLPIDSQRYYINKVLDISSSGIPKDSQLVQYTIIENHIKFMINNLNNDTTIKKKKAH